MIDGISAAHWAPTKCQELSDSIARWDLRSCMAAENRHSPAFEHGRAILTSSPSLPGGAIPAPFPSLDQGRRPSNAPQITFLGLMIPVVIRN
jgi:hypothetical protein